MSDTSFVAGPEDAGTRLDIAATARSGLTRTTVARLIQAGLVLVDGVARPRSHRLEEGEQVEVRAPDPPARPLPGSGPEVDVPVRFEDQWLLVVAKPAGLVVHRGPGHDAGTLVDVLLLRAGRPVGGDDASRPGIVHRLDAGTSGLMIVSKDEAAYERLAGMMQAHAVERTYLALTESEVGVDEGTIDAPVGRSERHRTKMAVVAGGRDAVTDFRTLERFRLGPALLEVKPRTGRTHQIRVHLAAAGYPVAGDPLYGRDRALARSLGLERPFLHAAGLRFTHPMTAAVVELDEPLPADLAGVVERLR